MVEIWKRPETINTGTHTLEVGMCAQDVPTRIMIREARQWRALQKRLPALCEITRNPISELVFSLRSKRRSGKARWEAAHWGYENKFLDLGVFFSSVPSLAEAYSTVVHMTSLLHSP